MSFQCTPFRMAFGLEAIMPIEFRVSEFKLRKGFLRPNQNNIGSNNSSNSANTEWKAWLNLNSANDNGKPL